MERKLSEKARKHMCITDSHNMTLSVKVALNPNIINQSNNHCSDCPEFFYI